MSASPDSAVDGPADQAPLKRVSVAVIDSGAYVPHPHLPSVEGGVAFDLEGQESDMWQDRLGHGTASAAAIHEKAPEAAIHIVKVFDKELATTVATLVRAIDWATERGIRLINLSLGTPNDFREAELAPAVNRAVSRGALIVSAQEFDGRIWYPGSMDGVVGVVQDIEQPREGVSVVDLDSGPALRASPYPRPVPGVPPEHNLNGISFAVANATGVLARRLATRTDVVHADDVIELLRTAPD